MGYGRALWVRQAPLRRARDRVGLDLVIEEVGESILTLCKYGKYASCSEATAIPLYGEPLVLGTAGSYHASAYQEFYWSGRMLCPRIADESNPRIPPLDQPDRVMVFWIYLDCFGSGAINTTELGANIRELFYGPRTYMPIGSHINAISTSLVFPTDDYQDFVWTNNRLCPPEQLVGNN